MSENEHNDLQTNIERVGRGSDAIDESNEDALGWKITALRLQRQFDEADRVAQEALTRLPGNVRILNERAAVCYDQRQYAGAIEVFEQVLAIDSNNEDALWGKAASLRLQKRFEEAEEAIKEVLDKLPDNATVINERGWLHLDQDQSEQANTCFVRAIELNPNWTQPHFGRIEALKRTGRDYEALEVFQQLERAFPDSPEVREQLGWYYVGQNDPMNAMREFEWILERDSNDISGITGLGAVYFSQARYEDAAGKFREVLDVAPDVPVYRTNLAWALVQQSESPQLDEAEEQCKEALRLDRKR